MSRPVVVDWQQKAEAGLQGVSQLIDSRSYVLSLRGHIAYGKMGPEAHGTRHTTAIIDSSYPYYTDFHI